MLRARLLFLVITAWGMGSFSGLTKAQVPGECRVPRQRLVFSTPPGAIPEINFPRMIPAAEANYLVQDDRVLGYVHKGVAKAYPYRIFWWHEVVNDTIAGQDITVTYCPLTNTGINFLSTVGGKRYTFLTSGVLYNNNLVLTANEDSGLWPQMCPTDVQISPDRTLTPLPIVDTTWDVWRRMFPNTLVVSNETGFDRDYNLYPYGDYFTNNDLLLFPVEPDDRRLPRKEIVFGITDGRAARAYPYNRFVFNNVLNDTLGGVPIVVLLAKSVQSGAAFRADVDGDALTFELVTREDLLPLAMRDLQTGTVWNFLGEAVEGPLAGRKLRRVPGTNAFWFGWASIWVGSDIAAGDIEAPDDSEDGDPADLPATFRLIGSYPNPARVSSLQNRQVNIVFETLDRAGVHLALYNIVGQKVRVLVDDELPASRHTIVWDGLDARGRLVPPGIYFSVLSVGGKRKVERIALLR